MGASGVTKMTFMRFTTQVTVFVSATLLWGSPVSAQEPKAGQVAGRVFAAHYSELPPVADDQVQVVYYRSKEGVQRKGAAHVYIDRQFHAGLLPGGYTLFCLAPGSHTLGAYLDDAPTYLGKSTDLYLANLVGGQTYYLKVREDGNTFPESITRQVAEKELVKTRSQMHALSRVPAVEACRYFDYLKGKGRFEHYSLASDVLFPLGKSAYLDIPAKGREAIAQLVSELRGNNAQIKHIEVTGHTDPQGTDEGNQLLGERRALTVVAALAAGGVPASILTAKSAGNREPVVSTCYGSSTEKTSCYAPNRRVAISVELTPEQP